MSDQREFLAVRLQEVKFAEAGADARTFSGYGAVFGNVDSYGDVIQKGAFKRTLREAKKAGVMPAMLAQHGGWGAQDMMPIGVWTKMEEDETGLYVEGTLADTDRGTEAYKLLKMGALSGLSIGFMAKKFTYGTKPDEPRRTLEDVELLEISIVTFPANPKSRVSDVKSEHQIKTIRDFEAFLREEGGFSHSAAKAIASRGFKAQSEPREEDEGLHSVLAQVRAINGTT